MTYDKLTVALLSMLSAEDRDSTNAQVARYLLAHADEAGALSIKELAAAAHVGTGTISRFARDAGFASFAAKPGAALRSSSPPLPAPRQRRAQTSSRSMSPRQSSGPSAALTSRRCSALRTTCTPTSASVPTAS